MESVRFNKVLPPRGGLNTTVSSYSSKDLKKLILHLISTNTAVQAAVKSLLCSLEDESLI